MEKCDGTLRNQRKNWTLKVKHDADAGIEHFGVVV